MVNKFIEGISTALNAAFGEEITIYSEGIEQDFEKPCFFISTLNPSQTQIIGSRYRCEYPFDIRYFPGEGAGKEPGNERGGRAALPGS